MENFVEDIIEEFSKEKLNHKGVDSKNFLHLRVQSTNFKSTLAVLKNKYDFIQFVDFDLIEALGELIYILKNPGKSVTVIIWLKKHQNIPSIKNIFSGAVWGERKLHQLYKINFTQHIEKSFIDEQYFHNQELYPNFDYTNDLVSGADSIRFERYSPFYVNFNGNLGLDLEVKDNFVTRSKVHLNPKILEEPKEGENLRSYLKEQLKKGRFESAFCCIRAVEECGDYKGNRELKACRMILLELESIKGALICIFQILNYKEKKDLKSKISQLIHDINLQFQKVLVNIDRFQIEIDADFIEFLEGLKKKLDAGLRDEIEVNLKSILYEDFKFKFDAEPVKLLESGVSGALVRSYGVKLDLRWTRPYLLYEEVDLKVNCSEDGLLIDFADTKLKELDESIRIILSLVSNLSLVRRQFLVEEKVLDDCPLNRPIYNELEGSFGLENILFELNDERKFKYINSRNEIFYQLQFFEFISNKMSVESFFHKIFFTPLHLVARNIN